MIIGLLISWLSVTYTVTSSTTVETSGMPPSDSEVRYERTGNTGQIGQMTSGNATTLRLTGWEGKTIQQITLTMHSNTAQGAGELVARIGEEVVWQIEDTDFANVNWYGAFTNEWVDITHTINQTVGSGEDISICIKASKNSLYIHSYTIHYQIPEPEPYEVKLVTGMATESETLREETIAGGVVLPAGKDTLEWHFLGWSEKEVLHAETCPSLIRSGERYFPKYHCTLWAVYSDSPNLLHTTASQSGDYALVNVYTTWSVAMNGCVKDKHISTTNVTVEEDDDGNYELLSSVEDNMLYRCQLQDDSTMTIQHLKTGEYIGYNSTYLSNRASLWRYRLLDDGSYCLYYQDTNCQRVIFFGEDMETPSNGIIAELLRVEVDKMTKNGVLLFPAMKREFTSWPFGRLDGVEEVISPDFNVEKGTYVLRMGNWELRVVNGNKYLYLHR